MDTASETSTQSKRGRKKLPETIDLRISKKNASVEILKNNIIYSIQTFNKYIEEINGLRFALHTTDPEFFSIVASQLGLQSEKTFIPKENEAWYLSETDLDSLWIIHSNLITENRKLHRLTNVFKEIIQSKKIQNVNDATPKNLTNNSDFYLSNAVASRENKNYKIAKASIKVYDICYQGIHNNQSVVETCNLIQQAINELF